MQGLRIFASCLSRYFLFSIGKEDNLIKYRKDLKFRKLRGFFNVSVHKVYFKMSEGYKDLLCMLERCLKQYSLWENNNSSSMPGFSRVKLPIIILSMESTCPSRAFPLSNATTSNASSAHTGLGNSGKMTGSFLSGWLLILLVAVQVVGWKERCRSCAGSQCWKL